MKDLLCALCASAVISFGCFSTVTQTRVVQELPEGTVRWDGPFDPEIDGAYVPESGKLVVQVIGTYRPVDAPPVEGVLEECRSVSSASLLGGEIGGGLGAVLGGSLLGAGVYEVSAGCGDGGCLGEALGQTAGGAVLLAVSATVLAAAAVADARYESDVPFDCVERERVDVEAPPPPERHEPVATYAAVVPGADPAAPTLAPAGDLGRIELDANAYLRCPERCAATVAGEALLSLAEVQPFLEEVSVEVPLMLLREDGSPGAPLGSHTFRMPAVRFAAMVDALAARVAEGPESGAFVRVRVVVKGADGAPLSDAQVRITRQPGGTDADPAAARPPLELAPGGPELFRVAFGRAVAERWRGDAGAGAEVGVVFAGTGEARTDAAGAASFLVRAASTVEVSAEDAAGGRAAATQQLPESSAEPVAIDLAIGAAAP
jgi:hypothetical protein